ncbi:hypothetical protein C4D60_Mb00t00860 [Musa balbisiana]|uniref:Uncharacterized protein n=1 Tax=Musa balbisiana TaxID=52838 RepID=A0A4S8I6R0_MUSBA|nr:hypothetical protein C4D60_Mb00t00860 [Musa balbisiana]
MKRGKLPFLFFLFLPLCREQRRGNWAVGKFLQGEERSGEKGWKLPFLFFLFLPLCRWEQKRGNWATRDR